VTTRTKGATDRSEELGLLLGVDTSVVQDSKDLSRVDRECQRCHNDEETVERRRGAGKWGETLMFDSPHACGEGSP